MEKPSITDKGKESQPVERRKYIRLNVVFPVEFQFIDPETSGSISEIKQGFTRDVGKGGICLEVNNLEEGLEQTLKEQRAKLDLRLHIPLTTPETKAIAKIAWFQKIKPGYPNKYLIGLSFLQIDQRDRQRIYFHAKRMLLTPAIVAVLFFSLVSGLAYFYSSDIKTRYDNKRLVQELAQLSGKKAELEKQILELDKEHEVIGCKISLNEDKIKNLKAKIKDLERLAVNAKAKDRLIQNLEQDKARAKAVIKQALYQRARFNKKVARLGKENEYLKKRVSRLSDNRGSIEDNLKELISSFEHVEKKNIEGMYKWVKNHQNARTGLVVSYEGDKEIEEWAFTYDQSLASQCFTLMGDRGNAKQILDFYKYRASKVEGGFANAYDSFTGKVAEYTVHTGPNVWLGIAILQYTNKFKDEEYLTMAENIANWVIVLQKQDRELGIRGGPKFAWFSTEHNLDAYAFFSMLYKFTGEKKYAEAKEEVFKWIKEHAFNRTQGRLNRGKGDATIATDTFAWAIAAIGPGILNESDMDPDQILDFAESNCLVTADYINQAGDKVKITGFDFGKYEHIGRGGIVSTEWTSQMIVAFKIMSNYYKEKRDFNKAEYYRKKSDFYLSEIEKMVIVSPSKIGQGQGCLPYATQDDVDTGHGWRVAHGTRTGSTAGTVFTIFARYNYNPLILK